MFKRLWVIVLITFLMCVGLPKWAHGQTLPDLILSNGPSGATQVIRSQNDTVAVTVKNVGVDTIQTAFDILVYLSLDAVIDIGDRTVGTEALSAPLAPNDSVVVNVPVQVPALLTLGSYQWLALVDASGSVNESDENNNLGVGNAVQVVAPPADLLILSGPTSDTEVNLNGNYTVTLQFRNQGAGPTQNTFEVALYLSADSLHDSSDVEVGRSTVSDKIFENTTRTLQVSAIIPGTHPQGGFHWLAVVDVGGAEGETNELNNVGVGNVTQVVQKLADLVVSAPPQGPNGVFRRGTYTVTTQIKNQGTGTNTSDFDVVIYLSEDLVVGNNDDVRVGDVAVSTVLAVDSTLVVNVPVTIPALQGYRSYQWIAVVDEVGFVSELNESNNSLIGGAVSVVPSPPDLIVENVVAATPVERGNVYSVSLDVVNQGDGVTTGAFQVSLFMSADDSVGNGDDVRVGNATVTDLLNAGDRKAVGFSITIPSEQAVGTYRLIAVADAGGIETEADETNNASFASVPIDVVPSPPDLLFVTDPAGKERVFRGVIDTVMVQIRNQGIGDASSAFDVFVFLSADGVADSLDVQVGALRVEQPILAGETVEIAVPVVVLAEQALGTYRWWARLDANNALTESDETNNVRVGITATIVHFPPDMTIFEDITTPALVARGGIYSVSVPVRNIGTGPATLGYQVEVFLSEDDRLDDTDVSVGGRKYSDSFAAGAEQVAVVSASVPLELPVASYRWVARVSVVGLQDESDDGNNVRIGNTVTFPVMTIEPSALDFGVVRVGGSRSLSFEVLNGGTARLSFEIEALDPTIVVKPQSVTDLPPGVPWMVTVTYTPETSGNLATSLSINSNGTDGGEQVQLMGKAEVPLDGRVDLDFDLADGNQSKSTYRAFAQEQIAVSIEMTDVPQVQMATLLVHYDSLRLAVSDSSWTPQGLFAQAQSFETEVVSPGIVRLQVASDQPLQAGSGLLGVLRFTTTDAFKKDDVASVQVQQFQYQANDTSHVSLEVVAEAQVTFDLACWADIHGDSVVEINDFLTFIGAFDRTVSDEGWHTELENKPRPQTPYRRFDADGDGAVNLADFLLFTQAFGQRCSR